MLSIKRTTPEDPDFTALAAALGEELRIRDGEDHAFYAWINTANDLLYAVVCYHDGQPAGSGALREFAPGIMEVKRMFVPLAHRQKGIASRLLQELENWCHELGYTTCVLETGLNQPEAIALYEKHGYVQVPKFGKYVDSENSVCFRKVLCGLSSSGVVGSRG